MTAIMCFSVNFAYFWIWFS